MSSHALHHRTLARTVQVCDWMPKSVPHSAMYGSEAATEPRCQLPPDACKHLVQDLAGKCWEALLDIENILNRTSTHQQRTQLPASFEQCPEIDHAYQRCVRSPKATEGVGDERNGSWLPPDGFPKGGLVIVLRDVG